MCDKMLTNDHNLRAVAFVIPLFSSLNNMITGNCDEVIMRNVRLKEDGELRKLLDSFVANDAKWCQRID